MFADLRQEIRGMFQKSAGGFLKHARARIPRTVPGTSIPYEGLGYRSDGRAMIEQRLPNISW